MLRPVLGRIVGHAERGRAQEVVGILTSGSRVTRQVNRQDLLHLGDE